MQKKKVPMRSCIVTRERLEKKDLIRVVKNNNDEVFIDLTGKANGRGAYLKRNLDVIKKCKQNKILDRQLGINVDDEIYEELERMI